MLLPVCAGGLGGRVEGIACGLASRRQAHGGAGALAGRRREQREGLPDVQLMLLEDFGAALHQESRGFEDLGGRLVERLGVAANELDVISQLTKGDVLTRCEALLHFAEAKRLLDDGIIVGRLMQPLVDWYLEEALLVHAGYFLKDGAEELCRLGRGDNNARHEKPLRRRWSIRGRYRR